MDKKPRQTELFGQFPEIENYYRNKHKKAYYGGSGIVRILIGGVFVIMALTEPSYELTHSAIALFFGGMSLFFGIRAAIATNLGTDIK